MKRLTLEATDENVLEAIKNNSYYRVANVRDFVQSLDLIEGNMFISLDARWGEGKTFYVRQIEKTLEYCSGNILNNQEVVDVLKLYFQNTALNSINLKNSYLPIYYNAWLYDNHHDPLMSLLLTIVKKSKKCIETKENSNSIFQKIMAVLSSISLSYKGIQLSVNDEKIANAFCGKDILEDIKIAEEIREAVKNIFNEIIVEEAQKMVIFIDELDRCRPSYAIEMLERIKHYFDDERIIFVVSVNKEQLIHTISKFYGYGFDATGYLNKFFDLNVHLPEVYGGDDNPFKEWNASQHLLHSIANELSAYYRLTLRDALIFKQRLSGISFNLVNDASLHGQCLSIFIPIVTALDIKNQKEKMNFLNGNSDIIDTLSTELPTLERWVSSIGRQKDFFDGLKKINNTYTYVFGNKQDNNKLGVNKNLKNICIKICNGFERETSNYS